MDTHLQRGRLKIGHHASLTRRALMSFQFPLSSLTREGRKEMEVCVTSTRKTQFSDPERVECLRLDPPGSHEPTHVVLPLGLWPRFCRAFPNPQAQARRLSSPRHTITPYTTATDPKGYRDQDVVYREAMDRLTTARVTFLSLPTGFGKTKLGVMLSTELGLATLVVCHLSTVNAQFAAQFEEDTDLRVQHVTASSRFDPTADVHVAGPQMVANILRSSAPAFAHIGTVIVDEAHIATVSIFTDILLRLRPQYLIALSATPRRLHDGLHTLFPPYFGAPATFIRRAEVKPFEVWKVQTPLRPNVTYMHARGRLCVNWSGVVNSLERNPARHALAVALLRRFAPHHHFLVLCHLKDHSTAIAELARAAGLDTALLIGSTAPTDAIRGARVLVAGKQKAGTGFDDPKRTALLMLTDVKQITQYEGRIRTRNGFVLDVVDQYPTLESHWRARETWYRKRGATIRVVNAIQDKGGEWSFEEVKEEVKKEAEGEREREEEEGRRVMFG